MNPCECGSPCRPDLFPALDGPLTPALSPSDGERVSEGRVRGIWLGSSAQFRPLTPSLSPSDGERVVVRPGEGFV